MALQQSGAGAPPIGPRQGWLSRTVGVVIDPQTWRSVAYLIVSFPIGLAAFIVLTTLISTGAGLAITLIGLPILAATMYLWCVAADFDRALTNELLGTRIPRLPFDGEEGRPWRWSGIRARLTNPYTWRALLFMLLRFPQGLATFIVATVLIGVPLWALSLPAWYYAVDNQVWQGRTIDTFGEALAFAAPAPLVFVAGLHILRGLAWLSAAGTKALLSGGRDAGPTGWLADPAHGDATDVITWRGIRFDAALDPHAAVVQSSQLRAFRWHVVFVGVMAALLAIINGTAAPSAPWALWPIWALCIPLAAHAGYLLWGWLGAHIGLYAIIILGLLVIDLTYSDNYWFHWPALGWGFALVLITIAALQIRRRRPVTEAATSGRLPLAPPPGDDHEPAIRIDVEMRRVTVDGSPVELTPKEFDLLVLLYENPGRPFNRGELLDRIWKNDYEVTDRTVDACVVRLRRKLGGRAEAIQTVWGVGYRFQPAG